MELRVLKEEGKTLIVEVRGETFTLTNLVKEELWNDPNVSEAAEIKEHPYLAEPKIFVKVEKGSPRNALIKACDRIIKKLDKFKEEFSKSLKG